MLPDRFHRGYVVVEIGFFHGVIVSCEVLRKAFRDPRVGGHEQLWSGSTEQRQRTAPTCPVSHPGQVAQLCPAVEVQPLGPQAHTRAHQAQDPEMHNFSVSHFPCTSCTSIAKVCAWAQTQLLSVCTNNGGTGGQRNLFLKL